MVTSDCHAYTAVDITRANSAAFIWERIFTEVRLLSLFDLSILTYHHCSSRYVMKISLDSVSIVPKLEKWQLETHYQTIAYFDWFVTKVIVRVV